MSGAARTNAAAAPTLSEDREGPDAVLWLDTGPLRLGIAPALGGRLLALRLGGREVLYRNPRLLDERLHRTGAERELPPLDGTLGSWRNYGGDKTWPAPQGWDGPDQWAGPPDPVLDSGTYDHAVETNGRRITIEQRSAPDPRTGLRVIRRIAVAAGRAAYTLDIGFQNTTRDPVRWAIWNVTQVAGAPPERRAESDGVYLGAESDDTIELFAATGVPVCGPAAADVLHVPAQDVVGKLGFPGATGWLAHASGGLALCQRWRVSPDAEYPDGGSRAEVWLEHPLPAPLESLGRLQPRDRVVELEVLGPLVELRADETTWLRIDSGVAACPGPLVDVSPHGPIAEHLALAPSPAPGGPVRVTALAGSFAPGRGVVAWQDAGGRELRLDDVGAAEPLRPFAVDARLVPPPAAVGAELRVLPVTGAPAVLDRASLGSAP